jgi:hypothetical protein
MNEIWKPVPGYGDHYEASNLGNIRVKDRTVVRKHSTGGVTNFFYKGRLLKPSKSDKYGHMVIHISVNNKKQNVFVHKMVLLAFVGECPDGMECCHNNGNASDNRPENLRWDTHHQNNQDRKLHGNYAKGEKHPMAKLTLDQVNAIKLSSKTSKELSEQYGIGKSHVWRIKKGECWI